MSNQQQTDWFVANGISGLFSLSLPALGSQVIGVFLNGLRQSPSAYTVSTQSVMLSPVPQAGDAVAVEYWPANTAGPPSSIQAPYGPFAAPAKPAAPGAAPGGGLFSLAEVVNDPDLSQGFTILRSTGIFQNGAWKSTTTQVQGAGVVSNAQDSEIEMLGEGDVVLEARVFYSAAPIYKTREGTGASDILVWQGEQFRVLRVARYQDYGFYRAVASKIDTGK